MPDMVTILSTHRTPEALAKALLGHSESTTRANTSQGRKFVQVGTVFRGN